MNGKTPSAGPKPASLLTADRRQPVSGYRSYHFVIEELARFDGAFAYQYALGLDTVHRQKYAALALRTWIRHSPDEAWERFLTLANFGQDRQFPAEMLIHAVAQKDISKAIEFYNQLSNETDCINCSAVTIIHRIFYNREEGSMDVYESQIIDPFKLEQWERNKWEAWGYYQPRSALEKRLPADSIILQEEVRRHLYVGWARYQPKNCIEHLVLNEDQAVFEDAFPHLIKEWGEHSLIDEAIELIKRTILRLEIMFCGGLSCPFPPTATSTLPETCAT